MELLYYILTFVAAVGYAAGFVFQKVWQNKIDVNGSLGNLFSGLMGGWTALGLIIIMLSMGTPLEFSWFSLACAGSAMAFVLAYRVVGFAMMKKGGMTLFTLFLMVGGMAVPYLYGVIFLHEDLPVMRIVGLVVIVAGVVLSNIGDGKQKINLSVILLGLAAFFLNGFTGVSLKIHQDPRFADLAVGSEGYMLIQAIVLFVISTVLTVVGLIKSGNRIKPVLKADSNRASLKPAVLLLPVGLGLAVSFGGAAVNGIGDLFQLLAAAKIPASAQFPICTGGCIAVSALADALVFKSKLNRNTVLGIVLCILGTCMFL